MIDGADGAFQPIQLRRATPALLAEERGDIVIGLAGQLVERGRASASVGLDMLEQALDVGAATPADVPPFESIVTALRYTAECDERVLDAMAPDDQGCSPG